jgi:thiosulfate dehydrogenase [quinone] large subunit
MLIGWHLLFEGISKLLNPAWSSVGFLKESQWILEGFSKWVISNSNILELVDFMNTWGLIAIGLGLIVGLFTNIAALSGTLLLLLYYVSTPPLIGMEYSMPTEGSYLLVNKTLIESIALLVVALFPTSYVFGIDFFMKKIEKEKVTKNE